jgi:Ser/Thr protein kinase RdoA (MazF antagonist)
MTDFYLQSPEKQAEGYTMLARRALLEWNIDPEAELSLIKFRENAVFSVSTGSKRYAMRIHRHAYHSDDSIRSELEWMSALNVHGLRTPPIIPTSDGKIFTTVQAPEALTAPNPAFLSFAASTLPPKQRAP